MRAADRTWAGPGTMVAKPFTGRKEALRRWEVEECPGESGRERHTTGIAPCLPWDRLFSRLVVRVPLGAVLKSKGVQEEETLFKKP